MSARAPALLRPRPNDSVNRSPNSRVGSHVRCHEGLRVRILRRTLLPLLLVPVFPAFGAEPLPDAWEPVRRLVGSWSGTATGQAGDSSVSRRYTWVMGERFLNESNVSVYPPQEKNKHGERHEHWGMFSYDKARKAIVLRQFHIEGFVNTYRLAVVSAERLVFESESFENFSNAWRARETYDFLSSAEFVETFELAPPGKEFVVYSRTQLKRAAQ